MFKRPIHNLLTGLGMLGVLLVGLWLSYEVLGSDKAKQRAITAAEAYVATTYPALTLDVSDTQYMFPYGSSYAVTFTSPTSVDTMFAVLVTKSGDVIHDEYEDVISGEQTYQRLNDAYFELTDRLFTSGRFPFAVTYGHGHIPREDDQTSPPGVRLADLQLDETLDVSRYAAEYGHIHLDLPDGPFSPEAMADSLTATKRFFDTEDVPFHSISLSLLDDETVYFVRSILYEEISSPRLAEIIRDRTSTD